METDSIVATRLTIKTVDAAKAKGKSAGAAKADAEPGNTAPRKRLVKKARYESMLGVYLNDNKPTPMVNLSVPNGSSVLGDDVAAAMRGRSRSTNSAIGRSPISKSPPTASTNSTSISRSFGSASGK